MGADELDIDSDWKKARAFLVAYSTVVLLAWYFSADLNTISMMGVSIQIKANAHNVWLVIAAINLYFMIRYVQKLPNEYRAPSESMIKAFEAELIKNTFQHNENKIRNQIINNENSKDIRDFPLKKIIEIFPDGEMRYRLQRQDADDAYEALSPATLRKSMKNRISYGLHYSYESTGGDRITASGQGQDIDPTFGTTVRSLIVGYTKGALFTPWFTDSILPLLFGYSAYSVSLFSWLTINKYI
ncbi:MAG: hypothetical protein QXM43_09515 [Desulfurococcaceae archaeon]